MGDIGEPLWRREFVPMPETEPVHEPSPDVDPLVEEPAVEPAEAPEKESVPA